MTDEQFERLMQKLDRIEEAVKSLAVWHEPSVIKSPEPPKRKLSKEKSKKELSPFLLKLIATDKKRCERHIKKYQESVRFTRQNR